MVIDLPKSSRNNDLKLTLLVGGRDSLKSSIMRIISMVAMVREKRAGYWNIVKELPLCCFPRTENPAPIIGPKINPREKATPINACG